MASSSDAVASSSSTNSSSTAAGETTESTSLSLSSFFPPIGKRVNPVAYPEMQSVHPSLEDFPGGAVIELEMMKCCRYTCTAALFYSPLQWARARRRILKPEMKSTVLIKAPLQRNIAIGFVSGCVSGVAKAFYDFSDWSERQIVERAIEIRKDREGSRWSTTTARMSVISVLYMIMYTQGPLPIRVLCGYGTGVIMSIPVSYTELDFALLASLPGS